MKDSLNMRAKIKRDGQEERQTQCGHEPSKAGQQKVRHSQLSGWLSRQSGFRILAVVMYTILVFLELLRERPLPLSLS